MPSKNKKKENQDMPIEERPLLPHEQHLVDVLSNHLVYPTKIIDENLFHSTLVLSLNVPHSYFLPRTSKLDIASFLEGPSESLLKAYLAAHDKLFKDMDKNKEAMD